MERCEHYKNSLEAVQDVKMVKRKDREEKLTKRLSKEWVKTLAVVVGTMLIAVSVILPTYTIVALDTNTYENPAWHLVASLLIIVTCIITLCYAIWLKNNVILFTSNRIAYAYASSIFSMVAPTFTAIAAIVQLSIR